MLVDLRVLRASFFICGRFFLACHAAPQARKTDKAVRDRSVSELRIPRATRLPPQ
jgi:hypothetical protein